MKKLKILILSSAAWDNSNSFGNTFSNLFGGIDCEIINVYVKPGLPNNNFNNIKYFHITDKFLIKSFFKKNYIIGEEVYNTQERNIINDNIVNLAQKKRSLLFFLIRELLWKIGNWKSSKLLDFINDFQPDVMYVPISYYCFMNKNAGEIKDWLKIPLVGYIADDFYSYKNKGINIFAYLYQFYIRKSIYKIIKKCEFVDCFSNVQKEEYEKIFNIPFKVRYKSANIENLEIKKEYNSPLVFLYTGNLGYQRWQNLVEIGKVLDKININGVKAVLNIYSATPLTKEIKDAFLNCSSLNFKGSVSGEEVQNLQSNADVLVHTESFNKFERKRVRMSLSTKIIDYLSKGKCLLAYGPQDIESINYIERNDCGFVIYRKEDLFDKIKLLIDNNDLIYDYALKSLETARNNHNPKNLHKEFQQDLISLLK